MSITSVNAVVINAFTQKKLAFGRLDGAGGLSPSYVRTLAVILQAALRFAAEESYCVPLRSVVYKPAPDKQAITLFTDDERERLERYLLSVSDPTALGILISLHTGLRIGEVCALRWTDIDFDSQMLSVRQTAVLVRENGCTYWRLEKPKTAASIRTIPLSRRLLSVIERHHSLRCSLFVVSERDEFVNPRTYNYRYHAILKQCHVPDLKYHTLRHTFASRAVFCGMDVKTISELLGHADPSVTLRTYVHTSMEQKRLQMAKLDNS